MADGLFFTNPCFVQYVDLLRQLHELIQAGMDESPEAEAIRDRMDGPGEALSSAEVNAVKGIAADFLSLSESPTPPASPETQQTTPGMQASLNACDAGRYHEALELLRGCATHIAPSKLATLRGAIWRAAGHEKIAALFFRRAPEMDSGRKSCVPLGLEGSTPQQGEPIT